MSRAVRIATAIWGVSILLSRVIGIIREAVIGRTLGAGADADAYAAAFVIPDFLNYLLAGGVLSIVFIPMFQGYIVRGEEDRGWEAFSVIATFLFIALGAVTALLWWATPTLAPLVISGFDPENSARMVTLTRIILPAQMFVFIGGLLSAVLQARDKHTLPALAPLLYGGSIAGFGFVLGPTMGAEGFAWGVLAGAALGPFGMPLIGCLKEGLRYKPIFSLRHPDLKTYLWLSVPIMAAFSIIVYDEWVLKRLGSFLEEGTVAKLQYARQIMRVPMGVFGIATGVAAYPTIARLVKGGEVHAAYKTLIDSTRLLLVLALTSQAALTVAGTEVATVIYGTRRMSPADLTEVGQLTAIMCLALGGWSAQTVLARGFYAMGKTWVPAAIGSGMLLVAYPGYVFASDQLGAHGLALMSSVAILTYTLLLGLAVKGAMLGGREGDEAKPMLIDVVAKMGVGVAVGVGAGYALGMILPEMPALIRGALTGGTAAAVCLVTSWGLGLAETRVLVAKVGSKVGRRLGRK